MCFQGLLTGKQINACNPVPHGRCLERSRGFQKGILRGDVSYTGIGGGSPCSEPLMCCVCCGDQLADQEEVELAVGFGEESLAGDIWDSSQSGQIQ